MQLPKTTKIQRELWLPVRNYRGHYIVSNLGRLATVKDKQFILRKTPIGSHGYCVVTLSKNGIEKTYRFHRIIAATFLGESKLQVNHKNGIKSDNRVENLEWVTGKQNMQHSVKIGLYKTGESHHFAKLKDRQVRAIRKSRRGTNYLADKYKVSKSLVRLIRKGEARPNA